MMAAKTTGNRLLTLGVAYVRAPALFHNCNTSTTAVLSIIISLN